MKLPRQSIGQLFREDFSGASPVIVDVGEKKRESLHWQGELSAIEGVNVTQHPGDKDSRSRTLCRFTIPDPSSNNQYWRSDELRLEYDDQQQLTIHSYHRREREHAAVVSDLDEIKTFVRHVLQRYASRFASEKKQAKIREFKSKAIVAQIRKLAKEEQIDFATTSDKAHMMLYIKVSESDVMKFSLRYDQFGQTIPFLREAILSIRQLDHASLQAKTTPITDLPENLDWTTHDTL